MQGLNSHEKMGTALAIGQTPQLVGQLFCEGFDGGLGSVISGVAGRRGDPLFRAGVDDHRGVLLMGPAVRCGADINLLMIMDNIQKRESSLT